MPEHSLIFFYRKSAKNASFSQNSCHSGCWNKVDLNSLCPNVFRAARKVHSLWPKVPNLQLLDLFFDCQLHLTSKDRNKSPDYQPTWHSNTWNDKWFIWSQLFTQYDSFRSPTTPLSLGKGHCSMFTLIVTAQLSSNSDKLSCYQSSETLHPCWSQISPRLITKLKYILQCIKCT